MKIEKLLVDRKPNAVRCIPSDATLTETAQYLMQHKVGAVLVTDTDKRLVGIVSERDMIPIIARNNPVDFGRPVSEVMTRKIVSCSSDDEIGYVLRLMNTKAIRHIPIINDGELVDMISIRELTKAYEMLQVVANTDPLTEVSNRRPFMQNVEAQFLKSRSKNRPLSMAMLDLDHFKSVNDTYGHEAGDAVLRTVSDILILEFRSIDLIGRLGGEEFAVIFPGTDLDGAYIACERVRDIIATTTVTVGEQDVSVTTSIGVAAVTLETVDEKSVLKGADRALYQAKSEGRNRVVKQMPILRQSA